MSRSAKRNSNKQAQDAARKRKQRETMVGEGIKPRSFNLRDSVMQKLRDLVEAANSTQDAVVACLILAAGVDSVTAKTADTVTVSGVDTVTADKADTVTEDTTAARHGDKRYWAAIADELIGSGCSANEVNVAVRTRLKEAFGAGYTTASGTPPGRMYRYLEGYVSKAFRRDTVTVSDADSVPAVEVDTVYPVLIPYADEKRFRTECWQQGRQIKHIAFDLIRKRLREIYGPERYCTSNKTKRPEQKECAGVYNRAAVAFNRLAATC